MPVILVELPAADSSDPNVPALIRACSAGVRDGECALKDQSQGEPAAVAIVSWLDPEHEHARLEVVSRADARAAWHTRDVAFREQDEPVERWRALGFAIAGLVGEVLPSAPNPEPKPPRERASVRHEREATASPAARPWHTALGGQLTRGLAAAPAAGVWLGLGRRCCGDWPLEILGSASESFSTTASRGISARFTTLGLGLGVELTPVRELSLELAALGVLDALYVRAQSPLSAAVASAQRTLLGGALRLDGIWPSDSTLAGSFGGELLSLSGATGIRMFSQDATESPSFRWGFRAGLRLRF